MNKRFITLTVAILLGSSQAYCWGDLGHSIVGRIAEENMTVRARDFVRGVLGVEPLGTAAVWPDHVRDDERFGHRNGTPQATDADIHDFASYHFCEIPTGFTYVTKPKKEVKDCHGAIINAVNLLKSPPAKTPREVKMIALRYLIHVVGDIHQPLHIGNGFDRGGNTCKVHWLSANNISNLHTVWDDNLVEYLGFTYGNPAAVPPSRGAVYMNDFITNMKRVRPEMFTAAAKARYATGGLNKWLQESVLLRESRVYPDTPAQMAGVKKGEEPMHRPYCAWFADQDAGVLGNGSPDPSKISTSVMPILDEQSYARPNAKIVETQLLVAGLRLAAILDRIAVDAAPQPGLDDSMQDRILQMVQDAFRTK
jgi:hypothetical protein